MEGVNDSNLLDTRQRVLNDYFTNVNDLLHQVSIAHTGDTRINQVQNIISKIHLHVTDLIGSARSCTDIAYIGLSDLTRPWKLIGEGNFGQVYDSRLSGSRVAIKVFKEKAKSQFRESNLLRYLSHANIIAYRGMGYISSDELINTTAVKYESDAAIGPNRRSDHTVTNRTSEADENIKLFIVMEFIEQNLFSYVQSIVTFERNGLSASQTWSIGQQITSALEYLHSNNIVHRDLKPDNILIELGPNRILVKVADFGLAWHSDQINFQTTKTGSYSSSNSSGIINTSSGSINLRWGPPEFFENVEDSGVDSCNSEDYSPKFTLVDFKCGDVYCLGLVLAYTLTSMKPFANLGSSAFDWLIERPKEDNTKYLSKLHGPILSLLTKCLQDLPQNRPIIEDILKDFFSERNPYDKYISEAEFFSCGFIQNTNMFVLDSCTSDDMDQGFYHTGIRPVGYDHADLVCEVDSRDAPYRDRPPHWTVEEEERYLEFYQDFTMKAKRGEIENNPKAALKNIVLLREGENEKQSVRLLFKETEYCHQQAMRFFWRSLTEKEKEDNVPCKMEVNPFFSNTFGVHLSVITNEGVGNSPQFIFPQRANRSGVPTPGAYTGGAVEGTSRMDYTGDGSKIDLVHTAARGLREELGLDLTGSELDAICLTTLFLAYDNHEWGLCGFVDLTDDRIRPENRVSGQSLRDRFVTGPKDKFEHQKVKFVPFELEPMTQFLFDNYNNFASYSKLAVVKVLQAYFGWQQVQREFEEKLPMK